MAGTVEKPAHHDIGMFAATSSHSHTGCDVPHLSSSRGSNPH